VYVGYDQRWAVIGLKAHDYLPLDDQVQVFGWIALFKNDRPRVDADRRKQRLYQGYLLGSEILKED
jgi:hypothetical protein